MGFPFLDGLGSKTKIADVFLAYFQPFRLFIGIKPILIPTFSHDSHFGL